MRKIVLLILIGFTGCNQAKVKESPVSVDKSAPDKILLTDLNGQTVALTQFKGRTVFINFWATWCKPCIKEMPSIKIMQDKLSTTDIVFLLASNESPDEVREFEKIYNYNFNYVTVVNLEELGIEGLPTTYIFNPGGELVFSETGYRKWDDSTNIEMILKINNQK